MVAITASMQSISENFGQIAIAITIVLTSTFFAGLLGLALYLYLKDKVSSKTKNEPEILAESESQASLSNQELR